MSESSQLCNSCGYGISSGAAFCENCGTARSHTAPEPIFAPSPSVISPPPTPGDGDVVGVLRYRQPSEADTQALREFQITTLTAGGIALFMFLVEILNRSPEFLLGWIVTGAFVAWRSFVTVQSLLRRGRYHEARHKLLLPAIANIVFLGVLPGLILLVGFFRSRRIEDAPPLRLDR